VPLGLKLLFRAQATAEAVPEPSSLVVSGVLEGAMLEVLAAQGVECNPSTQLVRK